MRSGSDIYVSYSDHMLRRYPVSRRREDQRGWMTHHIRVKRRVDIFLYRTVAIDDLTKLPGGIT